MQSSIAVLPRLVCGGTAIVTVHNECDANILESTQVKKKIRNTF